MQFTLLGEFDVNGLIIRCSYLLVLGLLIGYFGEAEKNAEQNQLSQPDFRELSGRTGTGVSLHNAVNEFLRIYLAERAYIVMQDMTRYRVFLWQADAKMPPDTELFATEVSSAQAAEYLKPEFLLTYYALNTEAGIQVLTLQGGTIRSFLSFLNFRTLPFHKEKRTPSSRPGSRTRTGMVRPLFTDQRSHWLQSGAGAPTCRAHSSSGSAGTL